MRGVFFITAILILGVLAGCGGGNTDARALVVPPNQVRLSYFHWIVTTVSGGGGQEQEFFEVIGKLALPQSANFLGNVTLALPGLERPLAIHGPAMLAPNDGVSTDTVPTAVYWGVGNSAAAGQPRRN